ncbi:LysR family transcriptional regulator [Variovorax sp. VNK109]|uniref:LysR family transcriptional regulator n=1 Tax=Variovorax sp. VNK109 TaxID=3400919 RepID=UPI003BFCED56
MTNTMNAGADRLELLQTFVRIVDAGSLSAAASRMGTTQPTVSRRLQQLERSLGLRLLQRSTHAMKLTEDGERCYAHAKDLLESWQSIEADLRGVKDEPRGTLRVVAPHAFGQDQLIGPLAEFLREFPEVSVEWSLHDRVPDFIADGVDCALRVGKVEDPNLVAVRIAEVPRIVVAAPGLWAGGPPPGDVGALDSLPWVALTLFYRNEIALSHSDDGREHRFTIRPRLSTDSLHVVRNAVLAGVGVGIVSSWVVARDLAEGRLVQLAPQWRASPLPVYLIYPHARFYPARLKAFTQLMRERMPQLAGMERVAGR